MAKHVLVSTKVVYNRIPAVIDGIDPVMDLVLGKGAADISYGAQTYIQDHNIIDTGTLLASQGYGPADGGGWMAYSGADYSAAVHEGTARMAGRPFLLEPYLLQKPSILEAARAAIEILGGTGKQTDGG